MDPIYLFFLLQSTFAAFYKENRARDQSYQDVIYKVNSVPSQLACMQLCRFRDTQALFVYYNGLCQCLKRSSQDDKNKETLIGLVMVPKKIVRIKENGEINFALNKPATQSSKFISAQGEIFDAKYGNDGNLTTHSSTIKNRGWKWLQIDMKQVVRINRMVFIGAQDLFDKNYYRKFFIETKKESSDKWVRCKYVGVLPSIEYEFTCDDTTYARHVLVVNDYHVGFKVREFEVYTECAFDEHSNCIAKTY